MIAGEKEIRCWTIQKGCLAPQAAGAIHGDFEKGFIKAEVVAYQDFHDLCAGGKSMGPIKAAGKYRQEGKTYVSPWYSACASCSRRLTPFAPGGPRRRYYAFPIQ